MHEHLSVAVYTRHRPHILNPFLGSFMATRRSNPDPPVLTILHDAPKSMYSDEAVKMADDCASRYTFIRSIVIPNKSGCARMINLSVATAPTDWVLVCNDDITFKPGWQEYLEEKIKESKHFIVTLFSYGAFLIHKSMMLRVGWWDERFLAGGFEDNDYQLRISEAGLKHLVDTSHDFIKRDGDVEVGHFVNHTKYVWKDVNGWEGPPNHYWFEQKWGHTDFGRPCLRRVPEIDWHPYETVAYSNRYNMPRQWSDVIKRSMETRQRVMH